MQLFVDIATNERDRVHVAILDDVNGGPFGKCVDTLDANTMQTARHLVSATVKLAAGMQLGHDHFNSRTAVDGGVVAFHGVDRHTTTVITDSA